MSSKPSRRRPAEGGTLPAQQGLVEEVPAPITDGGYAWRTGEEGVVLMLRATPMGLAAIGLADADSPTEAPTEAPTLPDTAADDAVAREAAAVADALDAAHTAPTRATLRQAAETVLAAWNDETNRETDIIGALAGPMDHAPPSGTGSEGAV